MDPYTERFVTPLGEWTRRAACIGAWELLEGPDEAGAKRLCFSCSVRVDCRAWVLPLTPRTDPGGVVAGLTKKDRVYARARARGLKSQATVRRRATLRAKQDVA